jgi:hypothetical protein
MPEREGNEFDKSLMWFATELGLPSVGSGAVAWSCIPAPINCSGMPRTVYEVALRCVTHVFLAAEDASRQGGCKDALNLLGVP